ncbi:MAG: phosphoribosylaminoimidazolecarboxamide formyltransferase / cyclohydrolase [Pseudonocardiales bacterium]|nr:phosphoribosylaminoimidazolecarboxamide formyltransferase / cyclohydrolase [Pseudonocardiales bacterium]
MSAASSADPSAASSTPGPRAPARLVVLASGSGTLLQALLDAAADADYPAEVVAVAADRDATAVDRGARAGVPTAVVRPAEHPDRDAWNRALLAAVRAHEPDLVVCAGFMRILGPDFLDGIGCPIVNTHPALLPSFPGAHAVRDALAHGVKITGTTVHLVDAGVDTGPILAQEAVPVRPGDTEAELHERIKNSERRLLVGTVEALVRIGSARAEKEASIDVSERRPVRRALISVYDKAGLLDLATGLHAAGVEIVSTGSTAQRIADAGIPVTPVEELTGFPETLDGRVKTLHPRVHAGLLADTRKPEHLAQLEQLGVAPFDMLVSNLYPFTETVASGATQDECVEQIDIGGPAMVRASAKNHDSLAVITDPARYDWVLEQVAAGGFLLADRRRLAAEAFRHTASYDVAVASWMGSVLAPEADTVFPAWAGATWERKATLRYGENPHQAAALYVSPESSGLAQAEQLHGKEMSYNNYVDADAAWRAAHDHGDRPTVAVIKHANPCGIAVGADVAEAHRKAHATDPVSAYGGVIATNREVSVEMAQQVKDIFTEVVLAPSFAEGALEILTSKKNLRVLRLPGEVRRTGAEMRPITGGLLLQQRDAVDAAGDDPSSWKLVAGEPVPDEVLADLAFAWRACRAVKSNAILLASDGAAVGVGMGQVNRVDSCKLAVTRAGDRARGAVAASDAFFPFPDGLEVLLEAGVRAVVHPGGSIRDEQVTAAAAAAGVALYLTGTRHFAH